MAQRSLVLVKPDGVQRGIVGEIITRFEKAGLKIVGAKMVWVKKDLVDKHYPDSRTEFLTGMGGKTLKSYQEYGKDPIKELGTDDPLKIGKMVNDWNKEFLTAGPVMALVLEGNHVIDNVRRLVGATTPTFAAPGTIRGDYSVDSPVLANERKRAMKNLIHASGTPEEAKLEIDLWFSKEEMHTYDRADEKAAY
jgi:nucleoside-diphosphate kinase